MDEIYEWSAVRLNAFWALCCNWLDHVVWNGLVHLVAYAVMGLSWANRLIDEKVVNLGFDKGCDELRQGGSLMSRLQDGRIQDYLRIIGIALAVLALGLIWGCRPS
jgi:NADH-quinone oxidoreductase subunit L